MEVAIYVFAALQVPTLAMVWSLKQGIHALSERVARVLARVQARLDVLALVARPPESTPGAPRPARP